MIIDLRAVSAAMRAIIEPTRQARDAAESLGIELRAVRTLHNRQRRIDAAALREEIARRRMEKRRAAPH
jgi:hypothetical protein